MKVDDSIDHLHILAGTCPLCDQVIPNDRLASVQARQAEHERELQARMARVTKEEQERLSRQHEADKAQAVAKLQSEMATQVANAREDERKAAQVQAEAKLAAAAKATEQAQGEAAELKKKLEQGAADAAAKIVSARQEAVRQAEAALQPKLAAAAAATTAAEAEKADLKRKLEAEVAGATAKVTSAREEATRQAEAALQPKLVAATAAASAAEAEKAAAIAAKSTIETQIAALKENQDKLVAEATQEARLALEKAHQQALDAAASKHFEDNQKLKSQVADLARQLEAKNANELGEGAEVDLFEALKAAYPGDNINRIKKGAPGADIRHKVVHNGKVCGVILYDSKNHRAWRNEFATKLRDDQLADKADHAILSTIAFPQGAHQLHLQNSVVLVNPARAVMVAAMFRAHIVQSHALRLSSEDREEKSHELYAFITSEMFFGQLAKIQSSIGAMLDLETNEKAAHNRMWAKRGSLIGAVGKAEADLRVSIGAIIGTDEGLDVAMDGARKADDAASAS